MLTKHFLKLSHPSTSMQLYILFFVSLSKLKRHNYTDFFRKIKKPLQCSIRGLLFLDNFLILYRYAPVHLMFLFIVPYIECTLYFSTFSLRFFIKMKMPFPSNYKNLDIIDNFLVYRLLPFLTQNLKSK